MKAVLDMEVERRRLLFEQAAAKMDLVPVAIEKDFWVCWTLDKLFNLSCGQHLTFKGGTSLSKVWKLIERFSEDIDITIKRDALGFGGAAVPHEAPSKKQRKKRLDAVKTACERYIADTLAPELTASITADLPDESSWTLRPDPDDPQTLLFEYPSAFPVRADYLRPWVKIEMGGRADVEPAETAIIQPYVAEQFTDLLGECPVQLRAIKPVRTFWEKAMLLHEENFRPVDNKKRKVGMARHYYDLHRMIQTGIGEQAAADFDLFFNIAQQREQYFQYTWVDYSTYQPGSIQITPIEEQMKDWQSDYNNMQGEMFFGAVPDFEELMTSVQSFQDTFNGASR